MKKVLAGILLLVICATGCAWADGIDWANMSDDEVFNVISQGRNEIAKRNLIAEGKTLLFEKDGISVYLTGNADIMKGSEMISIDLEAIVINDSDVPVSVSIDDLYINGWGVSAFGISNTASGRKQKDEFTIFNVQDAEVEDIDDIEDIEFYLIVSNSDNYHTLFTLEPITIYFN